MASQWEKITRDLYSDDNYTRYVEVYGFILSRIPRSGSLKILDIGCGDGSLLRRAAGRGHELYGVDISEEQLEKASAAGIKTEKINVDEDPLPFGDGFFDIVVCSEVIEHVLVPDNVLEEARRVLKSEGELILTTPNLASLGRRLLLLFGRNPFIESSPLEENAVGHLRYFVRSNLLALAKKHGFRFKKHTSDVVNFDREGFFKSRVLAKLFPTFGRTVIFVLKKNK